VLLALLSIFPASHQIRFMESCTKNQLRRGWSADDAVKSILGLRFMAESTSLAEANARMYKNDINACDSKIHW